MVARIDEAGHKLMNKVSEQQDIIMSVEGREVTGEVVDKVEKDQYSWIYVETKDGTMMAVYVNLIQKTEPDQLDHYEVDIHTVPETDREISWVGTVTGVTA